MKKQDLFSDVPPLISVDLLAKNINDPRFIVLDIREAREFKKDHIPTAVNLPFVSWVTERNGLLLELPDADYLFNLMGKAGIKSNSIAVVVNKTDDVHALADAARVAVTLIYAGLSNVAILDGGYNKWTNEHKPVSKRAVKPASIKYRGEVNHSIFVSKDYVKKNIGKAIIIDARAPEVYFGVTAKPFNMKISFSDRMGHIPTAKSLPTPWIWDEDGTYRSILSLKGMVSGIAGNNKVKEIIIYCGVGGNTAAWWYIMTKMLGYKNVKYFIGSSQEWNREPLNPLVQYKWE